MFYIRIYKVLIALSLIIITGFLIPRKTPVSKTRMLPLQAGVVLTFDDRFVAEWMKADAQFSKEYHWKATFFVAGYQKLDESQRSMLMQLQNEGHEIGFHGDAHVSALPFIKANSLEKYLDTEFTQVSIMKNAGLKVTSFAYPSGSRDEGTDSALSKQFSMLRGVTNRDVATKNYNCFFNGNELVDGIGIEFQYKYFSHDYLLGLLDYAKANNKVLIVYGHKPMPEADRSKHEVDYTTIKLICDYVMKYNLHFYTMHELAGYKISK